MSLTGHGASASPEHESTRAMTGFPHPNPLKEALAIPTSSAAFPGGEGDKVAATYTMATPPPDDALLSRLAEQAGKLLKRRGYRLSAAESCTGGWLAKCMTDIAGSSAWFERGFVSYSNQAKQTLLDVSEATLIEHGAVSAATVREMAAGALQHSLADISVAISGIAGPDGGSADKPVGTVWLAWQRRGSAALTHHEIFPGNRDAVRRLAVAAALNGIMRMAEN